MVAAGERDNTIIVSLFPSAALTRGSGRIRVRVGEAFFRPVPASVEAKLGQVVARLLFQICGTSARQQSMRLQFESLEHEERKSSRLKERPVIVWQDLFRRIGDNFVEREVLILSFAFGGLLGILSA